MESDSDAEHGNSASSDDNEEDRAIRKAKEADRRRKSEQKVEAFREKNTQKEAGMLFNSYQCRGLNV